MILGISYFFKNLSNMSLGVLGAIAPPNSFVKIFSVGIHLSPNNAFFLSWSALYCFNNSVVLLVIGITRIELFVFGGFSIISPLKK